MPDPELLPPPPPKKSQPQDGGLLPPPPKKKEEASKISSDGSNPYSFDKVLDPSGSFKKGEIPNEVQKPQVTEKRSEQYLDAPFITPVKASTLKEAQSHDYNLGENLWNQFTGGIGRLAASGGDIAANLLPTPPGMTRDEWIKQVRSDVSTPARTATTELIGAKIPEKEKENFQKDMVASTVGGLVEMIPAMGGKGAGLFLQAYDNGMESVNSTEEGKALPENVKTVFSGTVGAVVGAMDRLSLTKIFGKQSSKVATGVAIKVLTNLIKESEAPITAEVAKLAIMAELKSLKAAALNSGKKLVTAAATEGATEGLQEGVTILAEKILNKTQDKEVFEEKSWKENLGRIAQAAEQGVIGGTILGGVSLPFNSRSKDYIAEKVADAKSEQDIATLKDELMQSAQSQELSETQTQHLSETIDNYIRINRKVPDTVPNRKEVVDKIAEREEIQAEIESKKSELDYVDEAFQGELKNDIQMLENKANEINEELAEPEKLTPSIVTQPPMNIPEPTIVGENSQTEAENRLKPEEEITESGITTQPPMSFPEPTVIGAENNIENGTASSPINEPISSNEEQPEGQGTESPIQEYATGDSGGGAETTSPVLEANQELIGITHAETDAVAKELGIENEYTENPETRAEWDAEVDKRLADNPNAIPEMLEKYRNKGKIDKYDQRMMLKYHAALKARINANPTSELLKQYNEAKTLSDIEGGREVAKSLVARQGVMPVEDNLTNYLSEEARSENVETLPQGKIDELKAKYEADQKVVADLNARIQKLEDEAAERALSSEVKKKTKSGSTTKKTADDFKKERAEIKQSIKDKLKKARGETSAIIVPYAKELIAISPDVLRMVKSYIDEGVTNLADIVKRAHAELIEDMPDITERDVRDIIKGDYTPKKKTQNDIAAQMRELKSEQSLLDKLDKLKKGETPSDPIKRQKRSDAIEKVLDEIKAFNEKRRSDDAEVKKAEREAVEAVRKEQKEIKDKKDAAAKEEEKLIREFEKEKDVLKRKELAAKIKEANKLSRELDKKTPEEPALQSYKTGLKNKIKKLKEDLDSGDFLKEPEPKKPIELDKEALALKDEHIKFVKETNIRRAKAEFANRSRSERWYDNVMQVLGLKRIVQTAIDLSIPFRQGVTLAFNPRRWKTFGKSFGSMLQSVFSPKKFDRIMYDIHQSPDYQNMLKDKVTFNEMDAVDSNSKNEDFQKSFIYKIPIIREPLLASNRAADGFLNTARYDIYMNGKRMLEKQGITRENSPEHYEALGKWAMNMTGRGNMLKAIEDSHAGRVIASNTFFGARLMASRFNLLNPIYYANMPKEVRVEALKDAATFTGMIIATGAAAVAAGATVTDDIDDADFLKIKIGNTKYDISGGMVQYIRTYLRLNRMVSNRLFKPDMPKKEKDAYAAYALGSVSNFFKYKLAPNTSYGLSALSGKDALGNPFNPADAAKIYPMYVDDMVAAYKESGMVSLATIGLPSILGVGVQTYEDKFQMFDDKNLSEPLKVVKEKGVKLPETGSIKQHKIDVDDTHPNEADKGEEPYALMTDLEFKQFNEYRKEYIEKETEKMLKTKYEVDVETPEGKTVSSKMVLGKDLDKKELENKVQSISSKASQDAKEKMGLDKPKNKTTVEEY